MAILKKIAWAAAGAPNKVKEIKNQMKRIQENRTLKKEKNNQIILVKKHKSLPKIEQIANEFDADVEGYDTKAYVSKEINGKTVGVNISYDDGESTIRLKLERAFTQKPVADRVIRKVKNAAVRAKEIREGLEEAGEKIKDAAGSDKNNMHNNPDFGGDFDGEDTSEDEDEFEEPVRQRREHALEHAEEVDSRIAWYAGGNRRGNNDVIAMHSGGKSRTSDDAMRAFYAGGGNNGVDHEMLSFLSGNGRNRSSGIDNGLLMSYTGGGQNRGIGPDDAMIRWYTGGDSKPKSSVTDDDMFAWYSGTRSKSINATTRSVKPLQKNKKKKISGKKKQSRTIGNIVDIDVAELPKRKTKSKRSQKKRGLPKRVSF